MKRLVLLLVLFLSGCGPKIISKNGINDTRISSVAVLPLDLKTEITREHRAALERSLIAELKSSGFIVLDPKVVAAVCSSAACPERAKLFSNYLADATVQLSVESFSRNDFVAGYFNTIEGSLYMNDRQGKELLHIQDRESDRGGLLFSTGQVFQGVISQIENADADAAFALGSRWVQGIVQKIPIDQPSAINSDADAVGITRVDVHMTSPQVYRICTIATPQSMATLVQRKRRTTLREVQPGQYCGAFLLSALTQGGKLEAEVRSPYGNSVRKDVPLPDAQICDPDKAVMLSRVGPRSTFSFTCPDAPGVRYIIYRQNGEGGYRKITKVAGSKWSDTASGASSYAVVAEGADGERSLPKQFAVSE